MKLNYSINMLKTLVLCALLGCSSQAFAQQTIDDYSVLPENLTGDITTNPNVLIILDNSGSMSRFTPINNDPVTGDGIYNTDPVTGVQYRDNQTAWDGSSSFSNSYQVRAAMQSIINNPAYEGRINVGLMAFGQSRCVYDPADNTNVFRRNLRYRCFDPDGDSLGNPNNNFNNATNGLGVLRSNILNLSGAHKDQLLEQLDFAPSPWNATNIGFDGGNPNRPMVILPPTIDNDPSNVQPGNTNIVHGVIHPFLDPNGNRTIDGTEDTIMGVPDISFSNNTPLGGSLETAFRYLFRNDTATQGRAPTRLQNGLRSREIGLSGGESSVEYLSQSQCEGPLTVILLTDGEATQIPPTDLDNGTGTITGAGSPLSAGAAIDAAELIRFRAANVLSDLASPDQEVKVHVIGFNLADATTANQIAAAGGTDAATLANNTADVEQAFAAIFDDVLTEGATRSGVAIITSSDSAIGSFVQPSFTPLTQSATNNAEQTVWTGDLKHFFVDEFGNFRENTISNGTGSESLDPGDKGFTISFDPDILDVAFVETFDVAGDGSISGISGTPDGAGGFAGGSLITVDDLNPIWSGLEALDRLADAEALVAQNRPYSAAASASNSGRYIFSWADANGDNIFDETELNDFSWSASPTAGKINPNNQGAFDLPAGANSAADAEDLVNFIRGYQPLTNSPYRNRIVDGTKFLLGDIVHSTPVQIDGPASLSNLSTEELSESYTSFADFYADRRKVVYVGANDGMLHAFNGGFFNIDSDAGSVEVESSINGATNHGLGDELWAFIPNAVLPHLKFLTDINYTADQHISFVDGALQSYDVKIFGNDPDNCNVAVGATPDPSCRYVNGWGTILVGGLRLGGGDYTADFNGDGTDETKHSSFFILDVTDPESPPILLDEITSPNLNFTISQPALVQTQSATPSATERDYYLVLGSGPDDGETATNTSGSRASIFAYDLKTRGGILDEVVLTDSQTNSFVGDMTSVDWNADDIDDAVYFGTVSGPVNAAGGQLFRTSLDVSALTDLLNPEVIFDVGLPIQHRPVVPADQQTQDLKYLLFGTGRTLSLNDSDVTFNPENKFYGIQESFIDITSNPVVFGSAPVISSGEILNTTGFDTSITSEDDPIDGTNTREDILDAFEAGTYKGWVFDLPANTSRLAARPATLQELVFFTDFQPQDPTVALADDQCLPAGSSFLSVFDYRTGIVPSEERFAFDDNGTGDLTNIDVLSSQAGAAEILILTPPDSDSPDIKFRILIPGAKQEFFDDGATLFGLPPVSTSFGRKSWREINL